ncbi:hypothetical protein [Sinorhizobium sp. KGO-5]|uniref:hypothetical protein n=1 Tax=Sinorhizobium sp. KGO-5 TaxID=1470810 RepID=UPI0030C70870
MKKPDKPLEEFRAALAELDWDSGPVITLSRADIITRSGDHSSGCGIRCYAWRRSRNREIGKRSEQETAEEVFAASAGAKVIEEW